MSLLPPVPRPGCVLPSLPTPPQPLPRKMNGAILQTAMHALERHVPRACFIVVPNEPLNATPMFVQVTVLEQEKDAVAAKSVLLRSDVDDDDWCVLRSGGMQTNGQVLNKHVADMRISWACVDERSFLRIHCRTTVPRIPRGSPR